MSRSIAGLTPQENCFFGGMAFHGPNGSASDIVLEMASPLLGYNTNVRHKGKLYHIQTEDSGVKHPHIITHLFADGGRIVASKKSNYSEIVGSDGFRDRVKAMMREQHKAMFIALRDGHYDEEGSEPTQEVAVPPLDVDALDAAAAKLSGGDSGRFAAVEPPPTATGRYQETRPARASIPTVDTESKPPESIFGSDLLSEKSLDEVILSYLAEDLDEED